MALRWAICLIALLCSVWLSIQYEPPEISAKSSSQENKGEPPLINQSTRSASQENKGELPLSNHHGLEPTTVLHSATAESAIISECPSNCSCQYNQDRTAVFVDCSSRELTSIPQLPYSSREVYLQDNSIRYVPCVSFSHLKNLIKLDLSLNFIDNLHDCSFEHLALLEHLDLSQCNLASVHNGAFHALFQLRKLDLSRNNMTKTDSQLFISLGKLESLDLSENNLTMIKNDTFRNLSSLEFLSLRKNLLSYVPWTFESRAFSGLTSLKYLHLEGNQPCFCDNFTYPDEALSQIPTLEFLWLDGYPRALGPGFSALTNLSHLSFAPVDGGFCSFRRHMPKNFFSNLATNMPLHLNMSWCSFGKVPPELFRPVPTIHTLDLASIYDMSITQFRRVSKGLQNSTLTVLNISNIVAISPYKLRMIRHNTFDYLTNTSLTTLVAEHNLLVNVHPMAIIKLPQSMEYISFSRNLIVEAWGLIGLYNLPNLTVVKISDQEYHRQDNRASRTQSRSLGRRIAHHFLNSSTNLPFTKVMKRGENDNSEIKVFDISTKHLFPWPLPLKVEKVYARNIKMAFNIPNLRFFSHNVLKYLDFSLNGVRYFNGPIYGLGSLEYLDLSENYCYNIHPQLFSHLRNLTTLRLSKNNLGSSLASDSKASTFWNLTLLEHLDLSSNVIEYLPDQVFDKNNKLRFLNLSHNELRHSLPSFASNVKLQKLYLSNNLLEVFPERSCNQLLDIKKRNANFIVRIDGNPLMCNCDNLYFLTFLLNQPEIFENVGSFSCKLSNSSRISFDELPHFIPQLGIQCLGQSIFVIALIPFFLMVGILSVCGIYHFKKWQWKYLYYVGKRRLHIGSTYVTYRPVAHAFVTFDQVSIVSYSSKIRPQKKV